MTLNQQLFFQIQILFLKIFEFKNGKGGAKDVIEQAINYRKTAKFILENKIYFHIIIIAKKVLGNALKEIIENNIVKVQLKNLIILLLFVWMISLKYVWKNAK